ncbi:uncharacterized protein N7459_003503 [Penicillium hispanicum]|uniref:uncharacterized protein n=1 Tax=Penicillium hispanicum TaxID=1080232 RepID=UPI00253FCF4A|nr:uncharacterized protein N7459_003503 [Penicillium hispanicum]KAJ5587738.1 hypothetical protein N7459_003503 [Penicillium hispanicum]
MAYYEDRRYYEPRDRRARPASYAAEYYDEPRPYARHEREVYPYRGSDDSVEEIQRDYPPGEDYVYERGYNSRRSRRPVYENMRRASSVSGYDPYYNDGYYRSRPRRSRHHDDRQSRRSRYSSASSYSPSPQRHRRRKSFSEQALGALGLGAAAKSSDRGRGRGRSSSRHRGRSYSASSRSRSRSGSRDRGHRHRERSQQRIAQAARAALISGAVEAFRARKDPGEWTGEKGKRILTAAVTAAGTDGLVDKDPKRHSKRHVVESTLAGLAASHFLNGSRSQSRGRNGRGRSSGGGVKDLAATGALAAAGKEIYDRISRSRSRPRGRGRSRDSDDDDDHRGSTRRSKSVSDYISKGMAALGLGEEGADRSRDDRGDRDRDRDRDRSRERRHHRDSRYDEYSDSDADSDYRSRDPRRGRGSRDVGRYRSSNDRKSTPHPPTSAPQQDGARSPNSGHRSSSESDSDLGNSSDEKKQRKKMKRDMLLTSGLATVATIHAAHGVYSSVQKRKERRKQVAEGEITPEEARKRRIKANTVDAFSVGLAALGIKGAYGEWKEVNEKRKESSHFQEECAHRAFKRQMQRARSHGPSSRHRWPDEIEYANSSHDLGKHHGGVTYHDGNPYGATGDAPAIAY